MLTYKDLVSCYFKLYQPGLKPSVEEVNRFIDIIHTYERKGWTILQLTRFLAKNHYKLLLNSKFEFPIYFKDIKEVLYMKYHKKEYEIIKASIPNSKPPLNIESNLIERNKFYYHKKLQRLPKRKTIDIDHEGNIVQSKIIPYLEIADYFSIDNLIEYFREKILSKTDSKTMSDYNKKVFNGYLNDSIDLDVILFTIDYAAKNEYDISGFYSAANLRQYLSGGFNLLSSVKLNKSNKVKPFYEGYLDFIMNNPIKKGGN